MPCSTSVSALRSVCGANLQTDLYRSGSHRYGVSVGASRHTAVASARSRRRHQDSALFNNSVARRSLRVPAAASGSGGGVLDKPMTSPRKDFDTDRVTRKAKPPQYRVLLHNDNVNKREYVVQVLLKIIPGMTVDSAVNTMNEAHINGLACVIVAPQEDAENYCEGLRGNGLVSSIEPESKGSGGGEA